MPLRTIPAGQITRSSLWVFLATILLRAIPLILFADSPFSAPDDGDMAFYHAWALRFLGGQWSDGKAFYGLPGYPALLAAIYKLVGIDFLVVGSMQLLADAATGVIIFLLAHLALETGRGHRSGPGGKAVAALPFAAALAWAILQPSVAYSLILMPTSWAIFGYWALILVLVRRGGESGAGLPFWIGCCAGFLAMMVATVLAVVPLAAIVAVANPVPWRRRALAVCALALGVGVGSSPCWVHNRFVAGEPVFLSAHSGLNFFVGNHPDSNGYPRSPGGLRSTQAEMLADSIRVAEQALGRALTRAEVSAFWSGRANRWIKAHPGAWARLLAVKIANFWNAFEYDDLSALTIFREREILLPGTTFGLLAWLGMPGLALAMMGGNRSGRIVAGGVLFQLAALLPVFVTERYRLPAAPGLIVLAATAVAAGIGVVGGREIKRGSWFLALLIGSAVLVGWPRDRAGLAVHDLHNAGCADVAAGDFESAEKKLLRAAALRPDDAEIQYSLGNLRAKQRRAQEAKGFYRRAVEIDPLHGRAWNDLAILALAEGNHAVAASFIARAVELLPGDAAARYVKAVAFGGAGDRATAIEAAREAVRLDPSQPVFRELLMQLDRAEAGEAPEASR
jgi:tetratricopeptide (TPR) repeat protein